MRVDRLLWNATILCKKYRPSIGFSVIMYIGSFRISSICCITFYLVFFIGRLMWWFLNALDVLLLCNGSRVARAWITGCWWYASGFMFFYFMGLKNIKTFIKEYISMIQITIINRADYIINRASPQIIVRYWSDQQLLNTNHMQYSFYIPWHLNHFPEDRMIKGAQFLRSLSASPTLYHYAGF